jgi:hypothetical protein
MNIVYRPETNDFEIDINGQKEVITYDALLNQMPRQIVGDRYLINEVMKVRRRIVSQIGDFNNRTSDLILELVTYRKLMAEHINEPSIVKGYATLMKAVESEKNTARELRHGIKLLEGQEARFMAELATLEAKA